MMKIKAARSRRNRNFAVVLGLAVAGTLLYSAAAPTLVAHWTFDQATSPIFSDSGPSAVDMTLDPGSTPVLMGAGVSGSAVQLNWQPMPGVATRMFAAGEALQTDSFGFSFWLNPAYLNSFDNLIGKEMNYTNLAGYLRMTWQVQVGGETAGAAPVEFVVRGDNGGNGRFYGSVLSVSNLTLRTDTPNWVHFAGGYDAATGKLHLFFNGVGRTNNGTSGAHCSDGGPFSLGSGRNGIDFVVFAAGALIDDVQIYDRPLSASEVAYLRSNPGQEIGSPPSLTLTGMSFNATSGDLVVGYTFRNRRHYAADVSTNLVTWVEAAGFDRTCECGNIALSKAVLDRALGAGPRSQLYVRVRESGGPNTN